MSNPTKHLPVMDALELIRRELVAARDGKGSGIAKADLQECIDVQVSVRAMVRGVLHWRRTGQAMTRFAELMQAESVKRGGEFELSAKQAKRRDACQVDQQRAFMALVEAVDALYDERI